MKLIIPQKSHLPVIIALISLCIMLFASHEYSNFNLKIKEQDARNALLESLMSKKSQLEKSLFSRIYYTKSVAAYISINADISNNTFSRLAEEFIINDPVISTMALSKDCIIGAIYPIMGHESALGLNLLEHPKRRKIVEETVLTKKTFIAGPVELVEGGIAFISYTPIFTKKSDGTSQFWGVADIVIYRDQLFNEANMVEKDDNFKYGLKGKDGSGYQGDFFWGDSTVFNDSSVAVEISLPTGSWIYASAPVIGWPDYLSKTDNYSYLLYVISCIISLLIWLLSHAHLKISGNEKELKTLFGSMEDLIIVFNKNGEYKRIAPTNESLLVMPANDLIGKSLHQVFDKKQADVFTDAIRDSIATKKMIVLDYPLEIGGKSLWFQARISRLSDDEVLFVAHDNTQKKLSDEILIRSELELQELNNTKDKFFSIIAHDLRSPFNVFLGYTEILAEDIDNMSRVELQQIARSMKISATQLYRLLENLLEWSRFQMKATSFDPVTFLLKPKVIDNMEFVMDSANKKEIEICYNIPDNLTCFADLHMFGSVIRNLTSNAVKFTQKGGKVTVSARKTEDNSVEVSISDTGIGMSSELKDKVFHHLEKLSRKGTDGEPSTGLGLILCKEFVEKHSGKIWVVSEEGNGSTFNFTLP
ncbi:MAG: ATP-binding protein [Bacteroidota bacterium]